MAEQTIRVNVPDGYEVVAIDVPKAGIDYVLCGDDVILAPATVYSRVIVRKVGASDGDTKLQRDNQTLPDELTNRERKAFERYYLLDNKSKSRFSYHPHVQSSLQGAYKDYHIERAWRVWLNRAMLDRGSATISAQPFDDLMRLVKSEFERVSSELPEHDPWRTRLFCIYESIRIQAFELRESDDANDLVAICQRADTLRASIMQTWDPPRKMRDNEAIATVAQTATMQTIAWIMGPEFMGQLARNQQQAIDSGMLFFRAAFEDAKA